MLLISTVGLSVGFTESTKDTQSVNDAMPLEPMTPLVRDIRPIKNTKDFYPLPVDTQVSSAQQDETHLSCATDSNGNPFVVYDKVYDVSTSTLVTQLSSDKGVTWPEDLLVEWTFQEPMYAINPDISMLSDKLFAFGTFETGSQDPQENMLIYSDIHDPQTWQISYLDFSGHSTYIAETAAATKGENTLAIASICDYNDITNTILINWNCYRGADSTWPGVYWGTAGSDQALSHLTGDTGDKIFFCAEQEQTDGSRSIKTYYCNVTETTVYSDWKSGLLASSRGNCTYPDVSVSGNLAYCVYMDDRNGSQDVYVATTTSGVSWKKYVVADSKDDELYPVISANGDKAICMFTKNNNLYFTKTEDAGKTWSDPMKVNDDTGSVVSEYGSIDIVGGYGFWASNREGNNDIFFEEVGQFPEVIISDISGGFGIKVTLSNVGSADAEGVTWSMAINGTLVLLHSAPSGIISIPARESVTISSGFFLAIGKITITVTVNSVTKTISGFALGPFVFNVS
jgi:hypothetical protein